MKAFKVNKYQLLAYLYFFLNSVGLVGGLLYTNILTPFFYVWLLLKKRQPVLLPVLIVLIPFDIIHIINGVEWKSFLISNLLFLSTYIFVMCFHYFIHHYQKLDDLFKRLLVMNFLFVLVACIVYFTPFKAQLWYMNKFTHTVNEFYRLSLLTFEASYYSLLFVPLAMYYFLKILLKQNKIRTMYLLMLVLMPLVLSLSLGVIGAFVLSVIMLYIFHWDKIGYKRNFFLVLVFSLATLLFLLLILFLFFPVNPLFVRITNVIEGIDSSMKGRTTESFGLAWKVAKERSVWFGSGLGQIKILAYDIVKKYYSYWGELEVVRIPNAVGETLASFGIAGIVFRFSLITYLFIKTRVLSNYYRTAMFVFIFIYQFTGSYLTNIVEYVIWVIAFSEVFNRFDVNPNQKADNLKLSMHIPS